MRTLTLSNRLLAVVVFGCTIAMAACSPPLTDITSTASGDVGAWDVTGAKVNGDVLTANVCMERSGSAEAISDRLLLQLRNKGYQRIELVMYAPGDDGVEQRQVSWSTREGKQMQAVTRAGQNPCETRNAANEPATQEH